MNFLVRLIVGILSVWLTVWIGQRSGIKSLGLEWVGFWRALLFVVVLGLVNAFIRPIVKLLTLPLNCLTFGLFAFVVNALLFWGVTKWTGGITVHSFWAALFGSVVLAVLSGIINSLIRNRS